MNGEDVIAARIMSGIFALVAFCFGGAMLEEYMGNKTVRRVAGAAVMGIGLLLLFKATC